MHRGRGYDAGVRFARGHVKRMAAISVLLALACGASAQAASVTQQVYAIAMNTDRELLAVSSQQVQVSIVRAQMLLTPCLRTLRPLLSDRAEEPQALALLSEAGAQFTATALAPTLSLLADGYAAVLKLPASTGKLRIFRVQAETLASIRSLNACADARRWEQAGFAISAEPAGTRFVQHPSSAPIITVTQVWSFPVAEQRALTAARTNAEQHLEALQQTVNAQSQVWIKANLQ